MTKYKKRKQRAEKKKRAAIRAYDARNEEVRAVESAAKLATLAAERDAAHAALHVATAKLQTEVANQASDAFERVPRPWRMGVRRWRHA